MIEKALIIIIFMYASSFSLLGIQFTLDSWGFNLVGVNGDDISSEVLDFIKSDTLNEITDTTNSTKYNSTTFTLEPITGAAGLVVEMLTLLTGTYIFNVMFYVLGIPTIWIAGFFMLYMFLLMRTIVGYLRGI